MINAAIIGVGGIGSHLLDHINDLCRAGEFENWMFTIWDPDTLEPKNLRYQRLNPAMCGQEKVIVAASACIHIPALALKMEYAPADKLDMYDVVVVCVDSAKWRREFFEHTKNKFWIDLRSEGRAIAAYTKGKNTEKEFMLSTLQGATEENASCQLDYELNQGIIQAGNRIVAMIGTQYLLNYHHKETSAGTYNHRF